MSEKTDAEREQDIRKKNGRLATPDCQCAHCFLLRLLDAERARADVAEAKVARMLIAADGWEPISEMVRKAANET